jgi:integrase
VQLRDLRHESGSRFDEAGVPINYVSKLLGHASLTTTSRYLNVQRRELHRAVALLEERFASRLQSDEQPAADRPAEETDNGSPKVVPS